MLCAGHVVRSGRDKKQECGQVAALQAPQFCCGRGAGGSAAGAPKANSSPSLNVYPPHPTLALFNRRHPGHQQCCLARCSFLFPFPAPSYPAPTFPSGEFHPISELRAAETWQVLHLSNASQVNYIGPKLEGGRIQGWARVCLLDFNCGWMKALKF